MVMKTLSHTYIHASCLPVMRLSPVVSVLLVSRWSQSLYKGRNSTGRHWLSFSQYSTTPGNPLSLGDLSPPGSTTGDSPMLERTLVGQLSQLWCWIGTTALTQSCEGGFTGQTETGFTAQTESGFTAQTVRVVSQPKLWEWFHHPNCESGFSAQMWVISQPKLWGWFHSPICEAGFTAQTGPAQFWP